MPNTPNSGVAARTKARKRAANLLYEAEARGLDVTPLLADRIADPVENAPIPQYTADIVEGVTAHRIAIDEALETYSQGWTLERMPAVDRALLRVGAWEILYNDDVPDEVAIEQAVDLAASLSTDDSPTFVNGLLGRIAQIKELIA